MQNIALLFFILLALWFAGDWLYSRWVRWRWQKWEKRWTFDDRGVRTDCGSYTVGTGHEERAIVCVHGFNDSPHVFQLLAQRWAQEGYYVRAMRLPGFAERFQQARMIGISEWLRAVIEELMTLRAEHQHVYLVGHSLGGTLAAAVLIEHRVLADACVLLAPALAVSRARSPLLSAQSWHRLADHLLVFTEAVYSFFPLDVMQPAVASLPCTTRFSWRQMHGQMFQLFAQVRRQASQFAVPCFLALAAHDHIVANDVAEHFVRQSACPIKEVRLYERSAHVLPIDQEWHQLAEDVLRFLERCRSPGPKL